jgi:hypothetical protein
MRSKDQLEPLADGFIAFRTKSGERWKHKDVEDATVGPGYRLFVSDAGEERRYVFGPKESHDATILDLREQLEAAQHVSPSA